MARLHVAAMQPKQQLWHGFGTGMSLRAKQKLRLVPGMAKGSDDRPKNVFANVVTKQGSCQVSKQKIINRLFVSLLLCHSVGTHVRKVIVSPYCHKRSADCLLEV